MTSCSSTSSPSKSSRSVSSSPTSTLRTRARASSADESANKKINKTGNKESIEDWEISAPEILCNKKNIGMKKKLNLNQSILVQSFTDLRKILGETKIFLKSRFFLISNTRKPFQKHNSQNEHLKQYKCLIVLSLPACF